MPEPASPSLFDSPGPGKGESEGGAGTARAPVSRPRPDKAPDALRTIGEVADALGIRQHVLRYWEEQFPMLRPLKRSGGRRYYRPEDIALLQTIDRLVHREGYTLRGARLSLEGKGAGPGRESHAPADVVADLAAAPSAPPSAPAPADLRPRLRAIRGRLSAALDAA